MALISISAKYMDAKRVSQVPIQLIYPKSSLFLSNGVSSICSRKENITKIFANLRELCPSMQKGLNCSSADLYQIC